MLVARADEMHEGLDEARTGAGRQGIDRAFVRPAGRAFHLDEQPFAGRRREDMLQPTILLALKASNEPALGQARHDIGERRPVDADFLGKGSLLQAGPGRDRGQDAVLHRRDLEVGALLDEQGEMDLMQPPDQEAGSGSQGEGRFIAHGALITGCGSNASIAPETSSALSAVS